MQLLPLQFASFRAILDTNVPKFEVFSPGRVNLIGERTDYYGGTVLAFAINLGISCSAYVISRAKRYEYDGR